MKISIILFPIIFWSSSFSAYSEDAMFHVPIDATLRAKILMRKIAVLDNKCRAPGGDEGDRNCSERGKIGDHLERLGWCWDTEKRNIPEMYRHWIPCSKAWTIP